MINEPCTDVQDDRMRGDEFPAPRSVKAVIECHPTMVHEHRMDSSLLCKTGTALNPQTHWRHKETGAHPPDWVRRPMSQLTSPISGTLSAPLGYSKGAQGYQSNSLPLGYVYIHTVLRNPQWFNFDSYAKDSMCDKDITPYLLTDIATSTS